MKRLIKKFLKMMYPILNHFPFNNKWKVKKGNLIKSKALFFKSKFDCKGIGNEIIINSTGKFQGCNIFIRGNNNIVELEEDVGMNSVTIWIENDNNRIRIKKGTVFTGKIQLACIEGKEILIGENCLFSSEITIRTGDSHSIIDCEGKRINDSQNVVIGDHVWIGHRAMINKGVVLPNNSVVGAGAIVTKSFDRENIIVAGNPAKIIKENVNWLVERI